MEIHDSLLISYVFMLLYYTKPDLAFKRGSFYIAKDEVSNVTAHHSHPTHYHRKVPLLPIGPFWPSESVFSKALNFKKMPVMHPKLQQPKKALWKKMHSVLHYCLLKSLLFLLIIEIWLRAILCIHPLLFY